MTTVLFRVRSGTPGNFGEWSPVRFAWVPQQVAGVAQRVVAPDLELPEGTAITVTSQPSHGHASVTPDGTLVVVLADHTDPIDIGITADGRAYTVQIAATTSPVASGWGTGEYHYMLPVDENDRVIVEHGDVHRKVYVSPNGLTAAQIATAEGVSEGTVVGWWLRDNHPEYGATEAMALHPSLALGGPGLWNEIHVPGSSTKTSHWLMLERGGEYDTGGWLFPPGINSESPIHPTYIGAWGGGADPIVARWEPIWNDPKRHVVVQDISFTKTLFILGEHQNILLDSISIFDEQLSIQSEANPIESVTIRNSIVADVYYRGPVVGTEFWNAYDARSTGVYSGGIRGFLVEGLIVDRNGYAPDFEEDGAITGGVPPSAFSHSFYTFSSTFDMTFRNCISLRGSGHGAQLRGGAFMVDNAFIDNNIAMSVDGGISADGLSFAANYSLVHGNVVTAAGNRAAAYTSVGATDWGMRNRAPLTTLLGNIVCHANDPDNPAETWAGIGPVIYDKVPYLDDTIIYRWDSTNANIGGLNTATLDATTIQRYTATLLGQPTATIDDLGAYLRTLDKAEYKGAVADILAYFRAGFGLAETPRAVAATLRFVPDARGDGVRWDNRLNWSTGDLPGTVSGDSVDLAGNKVVFGGTVSVPVTFGAFGGLTVNHGRLTGALTGATGATLNIGNAGQVWASGASGALAVTMTSGRLANTGAWLATGNLTVSGGQVILATGGATFTLAGRLDISGAAKIGFDGSSGLAALVMQSGATLGFVSTTSTLPTLGEFRSGAFGSAPAIASAVTLAGTLAVTVTDLVGNGAFTLIDVDTLTGTLAEATVTGLGSRDAAVAVDRAAGTVTLTLTAGTGEITLTHTG